MMTAMPFVDIMTSCELPAQTRQRELLGAVTEIAVEQLGRPKDQIMVRLSASVPMMLAGEETPSAFVDVRGVGAPSVGRARDFTQAVCSLIVEVLGIPLERVYVAFTDVDRSYWGGTGAQIE